MAPYQSALLGGPTPVAEFHVGRGSDGRRSHDHENHVRVTVKCQPIPRPLPVSSRLLLPRDLSLFFSTRSLALWLPPTTTRPPLACAYIRLRAEPRRRDRRSSHPEARLYLCCNCRNAYPLFWSGPLVCLPIVQSQVPLAIGLRTACTKTFNRHHGGRGTIGRPIHREGAAQTCEGSCAREERFVDNIR